MPHTFSQWLWDACLGGVVIYAWVRGGRPERFVAASLAAVDLTMVLLSAGIWHRFQLAPVMLDALLLAILFHQALTSNRWWPMAAAAFQVVAVSARIAPTVDPLTRSIAAYVGVVGWDYLTLSALVVGTVFEGRLSDAVARASPQGSSYVGEC